MKKKYLFLISCLILVLGLCACQKKNEDVTYGGYSAETLQAAAQGTASSLLSLSDEGLLQSLSYYQSIAEESEEAAMNYELLSDWSEVRTQVGEFKEFSDFKIDKTGKTLTTTLLMHCSKRDAKLIYVFNANSMKITAMNVEPVYTLSEIMQKAALNTVMGIVTVFTILILISLIIYCFKIIPYLEKSLTKKKEQTTAPAALSEEFFENDEVDDYELVAVIAAAIAADTGESTDSFVVRSIKRRY